MEQNQNFLFIYPLPALLTPLQFIPFTTEEITVCTNEAAIGANKAPRNPYSCFFISCFTVSVTLSSNTPESSKDFIILIISFVSSFEINKVNPFPARTAPFPLIFLSKLFITFEVKLLTNPGKLSLAKRITILLVLSFLNYLTKNQKIHLTELF